MLQRKRVKLHDNIWEKKLFFATLKWPYEDNCVLRVAYLLFQEETNNEGFLSLTRPVFSGTVKCNENFNQVSNKGMKTSPFSFFLLSFQGMVFINHGPLSIR